MARILGREEHVQFLERGDDRCNLVVSHDEDGFDVRVGFEAVQHRIVNLLDVGFYARLADNLEVRPVGQLIVEAGHTVTDCGRGHVADAFEHFHRSLGCGVAVRVGHGHHRDRTRDVASAADVVGFQGEVDVRADPAVNRDYRDALRHDVLNHRRDSVRVNRVADNQVAVLVGEVLKLVDLAFQVALRLEQDQLVNPVLLVVVLIVLDQHLGCLRRKARPADADDIFAVVDVGVFDRPGRRAGAAALWCGGAAAGTSGAGCEQECGCERERSHFQQIPFHNCPSIFIFRFRNSCPLRGASPVPAFPDIFSAGPC